MLTRALFFVLAAALPVLAGDGVKFVDKPSGLQVVVPEGWKRLSNMESKNRPLVAVYPVAEGKQVQMTVDVSRVDNYDPDNWVEAQKKNLGRVFDKLDNPFSIEERKLGGQDAIGFTLSGAKGDKQIRVRAYHVVRGSIFYGFTEVSFNNAHKDVAAGALEGIWDGISFGEPEEGVSLQEGSGEGEGAGAAEPKKDRDVEDTLGNYKFRLPGNWELDRAPPTDDKAALRVVLIRRDSDGNRVALIQVVRFEYANPAIFTESTPGDMVQRFIDGKNLESVYGQNSTPHLTADIDESSSLARADAGAVWKISSITMDNKATRKEAETRKRRGEKGVEIPTFKPWITYGRTAMISPNVYHAVAVVWPRAGEDGKLKAEIDKIFDSIELLKTKALPPQFTFGPIRPGDTTADDKYKKARKEKLLHTATGRKVYKLGIEMTLPPGFRRLGKDELSKVFKSVANVSAVVVAQDANNNWCKIQFEHISAKEAGDKNANMPDDKGIYAEWKSNWESKARGGKVPDKPKRVSWGKAKGKGYKLLEGEVQGWPATFSGILIEKSGWMTIIKVETGGQDAQRWVKDLDAFFKKYKLNYKVK